MNGLWFLSRATGVISIVLMTLVFTLGLVLSGSRRRSSNSTTIVQAVHRSLALGLMLFLAVHILTAVLDSYVSIGLISTVLPFTSSYSRFAVGLGTLGVDLLIAIVLTSILRHRISERAWRAVHRSTFVMWPLTVWHGIAMGTSNEPLLRLTSIGCAGIGVAAIAWRLAATHFDTARRRAVLEQEWT